MTKTRTAVIAIAFVFAAAPTLRAQSACHPVDRDMVQRRIAISEIVTDTAHSSKREKMFFPAVADTAIVPVTDGEICRRARDAYHAALPMGMQLPRRIVYVIRVGNVYSVEDPSVGYGEFGLAMILDQSFAVLAKMVH